MDRITFCKQNKNSVIWLRYSFIIALIFSACSSSPIVKAKINLSPAEQERLENALDRHSNNQLYESTLANIKHPKEADLYKEANLKQSAYLNKNIDILITWFENNLSTTNKKQLNANCTRLLSGYKSKFPMTETTIACAGWWLEQRIDEREEITKQQIKQSIYKENIRLSGEDRFNWHRYQNLELTDAIKNMQTNQFSNVEKLVKKALEVDNLCNYKNANFALISTLEDFLPKKEAYQYITKIYNMSEQCYLPNDTLTERISLRMGVLHLAHGNYQLAENALKHTQSEKKPKDNSRSLFWLGMIAEHKENISMRDKYWAQLIQENPFGFFSILANSKLKKDPQYYFVSDSTISVQNRVSGGWSESNLQAFLFDLFYAKQKIKSMNYMSHLAYKSGVSNSNLYLYWANAHNIANNSRQSITVLSSYFATQSAPKLSEKLVKLNFPLKYSHEVSKRSKKIDPLLVLSLIRQESAFDPNAKSHANARGLMQMLPSTAKTLKHRITAQKLYDPQTNINLGTTYLETLFERYKGRTEYVLAAYNAGPHRVDAWSVRINASTLIFMEYVPYQETRNYVSTIMRNYYWYKKLVSSKGADKISQRLLEKNMTAIWKPNQIIAFTELE